MKEDLNIDSEILVVENEIEKFRNKTKELNFQIDTSKNLIDEKRNEILKAELLVEAYDKELKILKKEGDSLRLKNIDFQSENESLKAMFEFAKSLRDGSKTRDQLLNFDEVLKDVLPEGVTVRMLLDSRKTKL